jgi:hypothetical protein
MTRAATAVALAAALALGGCHDPYASHRSQPQPTHTTTTAPAPGDAAAPGPAAPPLPDPRPQSSRAARAAARSFATRWINWDWRSAARQQRALAKLTGDELARTLLANAESARIDATLMRDKPGSRGSVAAIDLKRTDAAGAAGLVVTHEQSYTDGHADLGGQRYHVYLIALRRQSGRWEVSRWAPQP